MKTRSSGSDWFFFKAGRRRRQITKENVTDMSTFKALFPANRVDKAGTPLLSWRVMLLPFLEQQNLYNQFHLNEPWDSPHNLSLLKFMPDVYRSIGDPTDSVRTRLMHFHGPGAPFPAPGSASQLGPRFQEITDGSSRTIAFLEAGPENAVPWTQPVDLPFYANNPFSPLGEVGESIFAAFFDGHIETLPTSLSPGDLKARLTHKGGENINEPQTIVTDPGLFVIQSAGHTETNEFGADPFYIVLDREPTRPVVVDLSTSDNAVAVLDRSQLTFTPNSWNIPQLVFVRGRDNQVVNADRTIQVTATVNDPLSAAEYRAVPPLQFAATVLDDEVTPPALQGDFNRSGGVDAADFVLWRKGTTAPEQRPFSGADGNGNGRIDPGDYQVWRSHFGATLDPPALATELSIAAASTSGAASQVTPSFAPDDADNRDDPFHILALDSDQGSAVRPPVPVRRALFAQFVQRSDDADLLLLANNAIDNAFPSEAVLLDAIDAALSEDAADRAPFGALIQPDLLSHRAED